MKNYLPKNYTKFAIDGEIFITYKTVDSTEGVKQLFKDPGTGSAATQIYIAVDTNSNTSDVYQVVDGHGANDITLNMLGSITLYKFASWDSLDEHNFV